MKIKDALLLSEKTLSELYPQEEARQMSRILLGEVLNLNHTKLLLCDKGQLLSAHEQDIFDSALERLACHEPIQYVLGKTEFMGLEFEVEHGVLIPRPETEELCFEVINRLKCVAKERQIKILDLGCGSGCIAITLAKYLFPAEVYAVDISPDALSVTKRNAEKHLVQPSFLKVVEADMSQLDQSNELNTETYDLIISNPPYIRRNEAILMRENVLSYEPDIALFAPENDPLYFYRKTARFAASHLRSRGLLCYEINEALGNETLQVIEDVGLKGKVVRDLFMKDRFIYAQK